MISLLPASRELRVLCLGAHPDDIEIGCGAALLTLSTRPQTTVTAMIMTGEERRADETREAMDEFFPGCQVDVLGFRDGRLPSQWDAVKDSLESTAGDRAPDIVFAPRPDDAHQDHRLIGQLVTTVWRDALVLHYEIPKWDADSARPNHYLPVDADHAERKIELLDQHFGSQRGRDWWDRELFLGLMRMRGVECRHRYAEAFTVGKAVLNLAGGAQ
ncbi:PIG-L deacetylase family protein [Nakamurella sp. GG22]